MAPCPALQDARHDPRLRIVPSVVTKRSDVTRTCQAKTRASRTQWASDDQRASISDLNVGSDFMSGSLALGQSWWLGRSWFSLVAQIPQWSDPTTSRRQAGGRNLTETVVNCAAPASVGPDKPAMRLSFQLIPAINSKTGGRPVGSSPAEKVKRSPQWV